MHCLNSTRADSKKFRFISGNPEIYWNIRLREKKIFISSFLLQSIPPIYRASTKQKQNFNCLQCKPAYLLIPKYLKKKNSNCQNSLTVKKMTLDLYMRYRTTFKSTYIQKCVCFPPIKRYCSNNSTVHKEDREKKNQERTLVLYQHPPDFLINVIQKERQTNIPIYFRNS